MNHTNGIRRTTDAVRVTGPWLMLWLVFPVWISGCGNAEAPRPDAAPVGSGEATVLGALPFADITEAVGLDFVHINGMSGERYFVEMMGSGGALFDYDNDGDLDLYLVQGHPLGMSSSSAAPPTDRLYRNDLVETGTLHFTDITEASRIQATGYGMGVATGDYDNDGFTDLYVLNWGSNQLWRNNADGTFTDVTGESGTDDPNWSVGASFLDFDRDGWLDLMLVNYDTYTLESDQACFTPSGRRDYCGPAAYPDARDRLFKNRGNGAFEDVTAAMGLGTAYGSGLGVVAADFNDDGWLDLAVANDGDENQLWINQAGRRFENQAVMAGVAVNDLGRREAGMGVSAADFDGNGAVDLFMTHLRNETNTLYLNADEALFEDRTRRSGLGPSSRPFTAFGIAPIDYDNDGRLDLFIAAGEVRINPEQVARGEALPMRQPNQLFRNLGQGRFEETTASGGTLFEMAEVSRGVAYGDVDNDGDSDVVLFNNNGPARLLSNEVGHRQSWLGVAMVDAAGREALPGVRVALLRSGAAPLWRHVHTDGSYASAHDSRVLFGLGQATAYDAVRVYWPSGAVEQWNSLALNRYHRLVEGEGNAVATP